MASKKIIIDVKVNEKGVVQTNAKMSSSLDNLAKSTDTASTAQAGFNKELDKGKTNAGLAGAIVTEFGRTISDLPYGIRGIGNNLSQLASLFGLFAANAKTSGISMKEAFGDLKRQFLGPIGILTLFQILIALLQSEKFMKFISTLGTMSDKMRLLGGLTKAVAQNASTLVGNFEIYTKTLMSANKTSEEKALALKKLNKEYPKFNANILLDKERTEEATIAKEEYIATLRQQALSEAALAKSQEITGAITAAKLNTINELNELGYADREAFEKKLAQLEENKEFQREKLVFARDASPTDVSLKADELKELIAANDKIIAEENKKLDILFGLIKLGDKNNTDSSSKRRDFVAKELDFDKEIIQSQGRVTSSLIKNNEIKIKNEFDTTIELARIKQRDFAESQQRRVDAITNEEDKAKAQNKINIEISKSEKALNDYIIQLRKERSRQINELNLDDLAKATELLEKEMGLREEALLAFEMSMATNDFDKFEIQRDLENAKTQNILENLDRVRNAALLNGEEVIGIDEQIAKTKEQLSYTQMKIDEGEAQAKLAVMNQVATAIIAIAGERSELGKAVAVAMATINTYEAVTAALGAKPYGPWNIAQAAATAAMGFVQVRNILKTDIPGSKGGSGGGTTVNAPDFNVVGASPESQLAQTVAEQQTKPIKAFVVGKDITNQQELDRNIRTISGLGD